RGPGFATRDLGLPIRKTCERRAAQHAVTKHHDADERPPMRALDAVAYNKACDALGCTESRRHVSLWPWFYATRSLLPKCRVCTFGEVIFSTGETASPSGSGRPLHFCLALTMLFVALVAHCRVLLA